LKNVASGPGFPGSTVGDEVVCIDSKTGYDGVLTYGK
jgi:hypothetical protein